MALKNANISLCCKAMSPNVMTVQWKKSDTELKNANITSETITNKKNTEVISVLNIYKVQHSDAGVYQCVVSNNFGATYSQKTNISVLSKFYTTSLETKKIQLNIFQFSLLSRNNQKMLLSPQAQLFVWNVLQKENHLLKYHGKKMVAMIFPQLENAAFM